MNLGSFKTYIESFPDGHNFKYSISEPFSWRGFYAEVAFSLIEEPTTKEDVLKKIESALMEEFVGYKGGFFTYHKGTSVNFESKPRAWSDGGYTKEWIERLGGSESKRLAEFNLVKLAFN